MMFHAKTIALLLIAATAIVGSTMATNDDAGVPSTITAADEDDFSNVDKKNKHGGICPGSNAKLTHAKCQMNIEFPSIDCKLVKEEMLHRINGDKSWIDPHNGGIYKLLDIIHEEKKNGSPNSTVLNVSRLTGNKKYTDLIRLTLSTDSETGTCNVNACSESQVTSVIDFSTNYCNIRNLYCGSKDGCPVVEHDFTTGGEFGNNDATIVEEYVDCTQRDVDQCVVVGVVAAATTED